MGPDPVLLLLRWAHILAAIIAMGGLFFARFGLLPGLEIVDAETRDRIHDAIRRRWLPWVIGAITVLLATGLANFLLFNALVKESGWAGGMWMKQTGYHTLFGAKFLLALAVFYFASALIGRGESTQWVRDDRAKWLGITLWLALGTVLLSGYMRQLHTGPNIAVDSNGGVGMEGPGGGGGDFGGMGGGMDEDEGPARGRGPREGGGGEGRSFRRPAGEDEAVPAVDPSAAAEPAAAPAAAPAATPAEAVAEPAAAQ